MVIILGYVALRTCLVVGASTVLLLKLSVRHESRIIELGWSVDRECEHLNREQMEVTGRLSIDSTLYTCRLCSKQDEFADLPRRRLVPTSIVGSASKLE